MTCHPSFWVRKIYFLKTNTVHVKSSSLFSCPFLRGRHAKSLLRLWVYDMFPSFPLLLSCARSFISPEICGCESGLHARSLERGIRGFRVMPKAGKSRTRWGLELPLIETLQPKVHQKPQPCRNKFIWDAEAFACHCRSIWSAKHGIGSLAE